MRIVIFGANGPTGRLLTGQAMARGHRVTAVTRRPDDFPERGDLLTVVGTDVHDAAGVDSVVAGQDAVISALGVPYTREPVTVYSGGARNIIQAMDRHKVRRIVTVSSSQTHPELGPHGGFFVDRVAGPIVSHFGRSVYADMVRMEAMFSDSDLEWTVMRPSGLFTTGTVTDYRLAEDYLNGTYTSRTDLADAMVNQLTSSEYVRRFCAIATYAQTPRLLELLMREGASGKAKS